MFRYSAPGFAAVVLTAIGLLPGCREPAKPAVTAAQLEDAPLTVSVSTVGRFAKGHSWHLSVNSAGQAELTIETYPHATRKLFQVPKEQWAEFRKTLIDDRFFERNAEYGDHVPDGSEKSITVTAGRNTHTVKLHFLRHSTAAEKAKLREASPAVRLLVMVRGWFDETEAVDQREGFRALLDAAKE
jgi:hypothetical protein